MKGLRAFQNSLNPALALGHLRTLWLKTIPSGKLGRKTVLSWALYDLGNSIWPLTITLYVGPWLTVDRNVKEVVYGSVYSVAMLSLALVSPMLGAVSDRYGRRLPFVIFFTSVAVVGIALIGQGNSLAFSLLSFAIAMFCFQSALIFYDPLLNTISDESTRGRVSGLGVAMGYIGVIAGILLLKPFVAVGGRGSAFLPAALFYLSFVLPAFLFIRESKGGSWRWAYLREGYGQMLQTLRELRRHTNVLRYLVAHLFYVDAITTLSAFAGVYTVKVLGFTDSMNQTFLLVGTLFAIAGAFLYGRLVDRIGPKKTLSLVLGQWAVVFIAAALATYPPSFYAIGALAGLSLGATWTTDRVFLIRLAPPEKLGQFFGLYGLMGKVSAVIGPFIWGITISSLSPDLGIYAYRLALGMVFVLLMVGLFILQGVRDR